MVQTIFAGAANADERPEYAEDRPTKSSTAEMQIGVMGAVPGPGAATSLAKSAQRASLTRAVGPAYQKTSICAPKALAKPAAISLTRALTAAAHHCCGCAASLPARRSPAARSRYCPLDPRHAEHHRVEGVHFPAGHALQHRHQLAGQQDRILSFMWARGMRPLPGHFEDEAVDVGVERAAAGGKFPHRQAGLIVHAKDRRHILQRPGADHGFSPRQNFPSAG